MEESVCFLTNYEERTWVDFNREEAVLKALKKHKVQIKGEA